MPGITVHAPAAASRDPSHPSWRKAHATSAKCEYAAPTEIPSQRLSFNKAITIALNADDPLATTDHEAIHALRDLGLFNPME